jgi:hypothetical protein
MPALAAALLTQSAFAWNDTGHKAIALMAWEELTPTARAKVTALLPKHPQYATLLQTKGKTEEESRQLDFMTAATWADVVRADQPEYRPYTHAMWHTTVIPFITGNLPIDKNPKPMRDDWKPGETPDNLLPALKKCEADIRDLNLSGDQKAIALTWIIHMTGDIHQPLHTTSWFSEEFTTAEGDKRGNYTIVKPGNNTITLHALWDNVLDKYEDLGAMQKVIHQLKKAHPRSEFAERLKDLNFKNWAMENAELCRTTVYMNGKIPRGVSARDNIPTLPKEYLANVKALGQKQLTLAGYRLADQLNRLFAAETTPAVPATEK